MMALVQRTDNPVGNEKSRMRRLASSGVQVVRTLSHSGCFIDLRFEEPVCYHWPRGVERPDLSTDAADVGTDVSDDGRVDFWREGGIKSQYTARQIR